MLQEAMRGIKPTAKCFTLPYAALLVDVPSSRAFHCEVQGLALDHGMTGDHWVRQLVYCVHKAGRPRDSYDGYRALGLNAPEGRLQEEIWMILAGDGPWAAVGEAQDARKDCLAVVAADMDAGAIRDEAELPYGTVWGDRKEAFDRQWRD